MSKDQKILFRCSKLAPFFTNSDKLTEGIKTLCKDLYLKNEYGYQEPVFTDVLKKGLLCEQDSIALVQSVLGGEFRMKNKERKQNDFIIGSCDIALANEDVIEDVKSSFNLKTFFNADLNSIYEAQGQGYLHLWDKSTYRLIYCLVPTPFEIVEESKKKLFFRFDCNEDNPDYIEACNQIDHNNNLIMKIPKEKRVKVFEFKRDENRMLKAEKRMILAQDYYKTLEL